MLLGDFEKSMDPTIVRQGKAYLREGRVGEPEWTQSGAFIVPVRGRIQYDTYVEVDSAGRVLETGCSCPYRFGPYCKHVAAALFRIRDELFDAEIGLPILRAVSHMTRDQLVSLLLRTVRRNPAFAEALLLQLRLPKAEPSGEKQTEETGKE